MGYSPSTVPYQPGPTGRQCWRPEAGYLPRSESAGLRESSEDLDRGAWIYPVQRQ